MPGDPQPPSDTPAPVAVSGTVANPAPVPMLLGIPALEAEQLLQPDAVATITADALPGRYAYTLTDPAGVRPPLDGILVLDPFDAAAPPSAPPNPWRLQSPDWIAFGLVLLAATLIGYSNAQPDGTADPAYFMGIGCILLALYPLRRLGCLVFALIPALYMAALLISIPITDLLR